MRHNFKSSLVTFLNARAWLRNLLLWLAPVGIGCAATLLAYVANLAFAQFTGLTARWWWWPFISLPLGGMLLTLFMFRMGKGTAGSGIQQTVAALKVAGEPEKIGRFVSLRLALIKFVAVVGGLASGFVLGLEGPTVQIGAGIFYAFRRVLPNDNAVQRRQLITAGGAAGVAAAFNAPMAGLIFAFEEMLPGALKGNTPGKLVLAVILAGMVAGPVFGYESYFGRVSLSKALPYHLFPLLGAVALVGGLAGGFFSWLIVRATSWIPDPLWKLRLRHPYLFVAACGLIIAGFGMFAPIFGSGAEHIKEVLAGHAGLAWYYFPLKFAGLVLTSLTGLPGGVFSPSLSIGAGIGFCATYFVDPMWQNEFICAGMVAFLAGVTRAPLTAAFIVIEMTDGHSMVLLALGAAFLAVWVARFFRVRFYHDLAKKLLFQSD